MSTFLFVIGLVLLVLSFLFLDQENSKASKQIIFEGKERRVEPDLENTINWTETQFLELFDSVFKEINEPEYYHERTKFHVRYTPDLKNRNHIFHEMYENKIIYEWKYPMFLNKKENIDRFMNLKFAIINEMLVTHSMHIEQAINDKRDKDLMERIEKLNK